MSDEESANSAQESVTELEQDRNDDIESSTLSTSSDPQPGRDRLTTLPPELLSIIFEFVREGAYYCYPQPKKDGTCKALLPYTRKNLYHTVRLTSVARVKLLARTVKADGAASTADRLHAEYLGSLVKTLYLDHHSWLTEETAEQWDHFDFISALATLRRIVSLTVRSCPSLVKSLLTLEVALNYFPELEKLEVDRPPPSLNIVNIDCLANLRHYPSLRELVLSSYDNPNSHEMSLANDITNSTLTTAPELGLETFELQGDFRRHELAEKQLVTFLRWLPKLVELRIGDYGEYWNLNKILSEVNANLERLSLDGSGDDDILALRGVLTRFTKLRELYLGENSYDDETLQSLLGCQSLESLAFGGYDQPDWVEEFDALSYESLSEFVLDSRRPRTLKEIHINFVYSGSTGEELANLEELPDIDRPWLVQWHLPEWPQTFTYEQGVSFVQEAALAGIQVLGNFEDALKVHSAWDDGIAKLKRKLAEVELKWGHFAEEDSEVGEGKDGAE